MQILMVNMILLIATFNFVQLVLKKFFKLKSNSSALFCGITAYCGSEPANPNIIKMIMMYNEERGEDSTGWAVNNVITKDTEKVKKFITQHELVTSDEDENYTIVAHARKASSGHKYSKELAHPFGVYIGEVEKEKYDLVLAMNGTLTNANLLSEKWGVEFKVGTNSDTQMLARAMAKLGEEDYTEALELYDGTATLAFFSPKYQNTLMIYKDPERTLFYWCASESQMYISSMEEPLVAIGAQKLEVKSFEANTLYTIVGGKIKVEKKIVRTPLKPKITNYKTANYGHGGHQNKFWQDDMDDMRGWENMGSDRDWET